MYILWVVFFVIFSAEFDGSSILQNYVSRPFFLPSSKCLKSVLRLGFQALCHIFDMISLNTMDVFLFFCWLKKILALQSLTGSLQGRITYREIPVIITGNRYAEYNFCLFWLHFFPCFNNIEIVAMCTGNWKIILQGLKGCFDTL